MTGPPFQPRGNAPWASGTFAAFSEEYRQEGSRNGEHGSASADGEYAAHTWFDGRPRKRIHAFPDSTPRLCLIVQVRRRHLGADGFAPGVQAGALRAHLSRHRGGQVVLL